MTNEESGKSGLKRKAIHEFEDLAVVFLYLAFFFCALATYSMLLLKEFHVSYFIYGFALLKAFVIAKVILIGEYAHLGKKHEVKPLFFSALHKAFLFSLLVLAFHMVEEVIKQLLHGGRAVAAFHDIRIDDLLGRSAVVFCTFIPLFAFRELRRVMGEDKFLDLFFRVGTNKSDAASGM